MSECRSELHARDIRLGAKGMSEKCEERSEKYENRGKVRVQGRKGVEMGARARVLERGPRGESYVGKWEVGEEVER